MKVMSTWIFVILTGYCHIGSQHGRVPMQVLAGRPGNEGGVGGAGRSRMKMWSSLGRSSQNLKTESNLIETRVVIMFVRWSSRAIRTWGFYQEEEGKNSNRINTTCITLGHHVKVSRLERIWWGITSGFDFDSDSDSSTLRWRKSTSCGKSMSFKFSFCPICGELIERPVPI